jgi:hypothetical protein
MTKTPTYYTAVFTYKGATWSQSICTTTGVSDAQKASYEEMARDTAKEYASESSLDLWATSPKMTNERRMEIEREQHRRIDATPVQWFVTDEKPRGSIEYLPCAKEFR